MNDSTPQAGPGYFATTHWSVVLQAGRHDAASSRAALESLCRTYWFPLYAYARRRGNSVEDAQDLTQQFFASILQRNLLARADKSKGRFRTFLLVTMEGFLNNEWDKARALKRGGGQTFVPIDTSHAETRYGVEPVDERTPEQLFEFNWAVALLQQVLAQLESEYQARGQAGIFAVLKPWLIGAPTAHSFGELAAQVGMNEGAVRVALHRLRGRYRELLRAEIANTVASPSEIDSEMHHLFKVLARR